MAKFTREKIEEMVNDIIIEELGVDECMIKPEAKLGQDLGADSLDAVSITIDVEHQFDIHIEDDEMDAMRDCTVSEVYDLIDRKAK